jgi:hypothetical protein
MNHKKTQHSFLCFVLCMICTVMAIPAAAQDQQTTPRALDFQGGKVDNPQSFLISNNSSVIQSECDLHNCVLTITNGSTNPTIRTVYNSGGGNFTLRCQTFGGGTVGATITLAPGSLLSGMACPSNAATLNLVCPADRCSYNYVP